jgi:hypothetical protein
MNSPSVLTQLQKHARERFGYTKFAKGGGACFECLDYEGMYGDLETFLDSEIRIAVESVVEEIDSKLYDMVAYKIGPDEWDGVHRLLSTLTQPEKIK